MFSLRWLISLLIVLAGSSARAAVESPEVLAGVAAYQDLEYDRAIDVLQKALKQTLTREEKLVAYKTLALCHVAVDRQELAIVDFENVLRIDESFELDRASSPRERSALEEAKARFAIGQVETRPGGGGREQSPLRPEVSPAQPRAGQPVRMRVYYPGGVAEKLGLFYRTRGLGLYNHLVVGGDGAGHFELTVPGPRVQAPGLEYYLVALDDTGVSVANAGSLPRPLTLAVTEPKKPAYKRGWFWLVIGGVAVAGAAVGTAVALTRSTVSSSTPSTVTIMPF
jgi:hypothetical protein